MIDLTAFDIETITSSMRPLKERDGVYVLVIKATRKDLDNVELTLFSDSADKLQIKQDFHD